MMDEATALTKWCPLVRFKSAETGSGPAFNRQRVSSDLDDVNCIGSKCMAWRPEMVDANDDPKDIEARWVESGRGYCGAFGGGAFGGKS